MSLQASQYFFLSNVISNFSFSLLLILSSAKSFFFCWIKNSE